MHAHHSYARAFRFTLILLAAIGQSTMGGGRACCASQNKGPFSIPQPSTDLVSHAFHLVSSDLRPHSIAPIPLLRCSSHFSSLSPPSFRRLWVVARALRPIRTPSRACIPTPVYSKNLDQLGSC